MKARATLFGYGMMEASRLSGVSYTDVWRHAHNVRTISPKFAIRYHNTLNVPLHEIRPDLWSPEMFPDSQDTPCETEEEQQNAT